MIDQELLTNVSRWAYDRGLKLLQGYRLAATDRGHIERLLDYMAPEQESLWVDIGSGFGEPARIMRELRPDLDFSLVNNNQFQLAHTPVDLAIYEADMHDLPFQPRVFSGAMFLWSLCHADDLGRVLSEAHRVVAPGGRLFVFDYLRISGNNQITREQLAADFHRIDKLDLEARVAGWDRVTFELPFEGNDDLFRGLFDQPASADRILAGLRPVIIQATRR